MDDSYFIVILRRVPTSAKSHKTPQYPNRRTFLKMKIYTDCLTSTNRCPCLFFAISKLSTNSYLTLDFGRAYVSRNEIMYRWPRMCHCFTFFIFDRCACVSRNAQKVKWNSSLRSLPFSITLTKVTPHKLSEMRMEMWQGPRRKSIPNYYILWCFKSRGC